MRYMLTDDLRAAMAPLVRAAKRHRGGQPPVRPDRQFFVALLYLARTGVAWRELPAEFGDVRRVLVDSAIVRAHQHAAGAPRREKTSGRRGPRQAGRSDAVAAG